jgi:hypothetical protein
MRAEDGISLILSAAILRSVRPHGGRMLIDLARWREMVRQFTPNWFTAALPCMSCNYQPLRCYTGGAPSLPRRTVDRGSAIRPASSGAHERVGHPSGLFPCSRRGVDQPFTHPLLRRCPRLLSSPSQHRVHSIKPTGMQPDPSSPAQLASYPTPG